MNITIINDFHNTAVNFKIRPLSKKEYMEGKVGYFIDKHSNDNYANYYLRLSEYQTARLFSKTCGIKDCTCHKFTLQDFNHAEFSRSRERLTIEVMSVLIKAN